MTNYMRGERSPDIRDLQIKLSELGYKLPRFGADSEFGSETVSALESWATDVGIPEAEGGLSDAEITSACVQFLSYYDGHRGQTPRGDRCITLEGDRENVKGIRLWKDIDSIVLHHTACLLSIDRWKTVPIHIGIPRSSGYLGRFFNLHPLPTYLYHANKLNARSIGIEIEGNFCGLDGVQSSWWPTGGGPHKLEPLQIEACRASIDWIVNEAHAAGGAIRNIFAHRQSSDQRRSDPGDVIWRELGRWAIDKLGLDDGGPGFKVEPGMLLPDPWTGENRGVKY